MTLTYEEALERGIAYNDALDAAIANAAFPREFQDDERFCREALIVQDKQGKLVPAIWGPSQRRLFDAIHSQQEAGKPVRIIALKPRQVYWSTGVAMKFWKETAFREGQRAMVYAHDEDSAQRIFEYYERFHSNYKPYHGLQLPKSNKPSLTEGIRYVNRSAIEIHTANNVVGGRSRTARRLHLSEYAFYRDAAQLMTGLLQALPDDPDTMLVIESTANGMGGPFYDMWNRATEGKNDFLPIFFAWWEHPEYKRPLSMAPDRFQESMDKEERELMRRDRLTLEQVNWRRWAIENKCEGDADRFRQEYPGTPEEAFLSSGRPRFRTAYIRRHTGVEGEKGELRVEEIEHGIQRTRTSFFPNERGALTVWTKPEAGKQYVIGADTAEGIDINDGSGTADPDYASADVFEASIRLQVAQLRERLTPSEFGRYLYELGKWYHFAFIVLEVNSSGMGTLETLLDLGYPQERIYKRPILDEGGKQRTTKMGWKTTSANRENLITGYESALAGAGDGGIILRSAVSIREAMTFVIKPNGRTEAQPGCHDDTVFSGALATRGLSEMPKMAVTAPAPYEPSRNPILLARMKQQNGNGVLKRY